MSAGRRALVGLFFHTVNLALFFLTVSGGTDRFYRLSLELLTTSSRTEIELLGGTMIVDHWAFAQAAMYMPKVTTFPFIRVSKDWGSADTVLFDVHVAIPEGSSPKWRIGKESGGWAKLSVYTAGAPESEGRVLLGEYSNRGDAPLASNSKTAALPVERLVELAEPVSLGCDPSSPTFLPCEQILDLRYATIPGTNPAFTSLDLYLPPRDTRNPPPLILWLHGGGWTRGDKGDRPPYQTNLHGALGEFYAIAHVNYRLSQIAPFPAQIEDCKAAVRWLRARAEEYGYDPDRIGVWGLSAGGHLAALLGTTPGMPELEGTLGEYLAQSSVVQAVCDFVGPTDITRLAEQAPDTSREELAGYVTQLLGGSLADRHDLAVLASPVFHASAGDAPFLIVQGDEDVLVAIEQATALQNALVAAGVSSELVILPGASHVFPYSVDVVSAVRRFFDQYLADLP